MEDTLFYIKNMQMTEQGIVETEYTARGNVSVDNQCCVIKYEEIDEDSGSVMTTINVEPKGISLTREGEMSAQFVFEAQKVYSTVYKTPYGDFDMSMMPIDMNFDLKETQGNLDVEYVLNLGGNQSVHHLSLSYSNIKN